MKWYGKQISSKRYTDGRLFTYDFYGEIAAFEFIFEE